MFFAISFKTNYTLFLIYKYPLELKNVTCGNRKDYYFLIVNINQSNYCFTGF